MRTGGWRIQGWFFAAAVVLAGAAGRHVLREAVQPPGRKALRAPEVVRDREAPENQPSLVASSVEVRPQIAPIKAVAPPREVEADPARLREWLPQIPDDQFARLVGTRRLNGYVARVYDELAEKTSEVDEGPTEAGEFLGRLNARIVSVRNQGR